MSLTAYDNRLDAYKMTLGLPPDLNVKIADPLVKQFDLIDPELNRSLDQAEALGTALILAVPADWRERLTGIDRQAEQHLVAVEQDLKSLERGCPSVAGAFSSSSGARTCADSQVDRSLYDVRNAG